MTAPQTVRIALCDDQALVLRGLSSLLADLGVEIALEATDAEQLLAAILKRPVDLIVSDIRMPGLGGLGLLRELRARGDATPVILLTTFDDPTLMMQAVDAGAQGFLLKDASPEELKTAILGRRRRNIAAAGELGAGSRRLDRPHVRNSQLAAERTRALDPPSGRRWLLQ